MRRYAGFKVLLDDAAETPGLGFGDYSSALSEMIVHSRAEFAVGIFGSWGSGKTTLMRAIERELAAYADVVTVWFTAWRYEKEPHLIVPLLDVLREELDRRAALEQLPQGPARRAAAAIAKAGRAFLAGLSVSARLPGVDVQWEPDKVIAALKAGNGDGAESLSFYQAGFVMLRDAINEFSAGGSRRVVVFVDDLDRCLPSNALDVLESMKLFFDVEGFVFVVGLDQTIAERAVALKYDAGLGSSGAPISGTDYVKKIFQVPFALPRISTDQLQNYLDTIAANAGLLDEQRADFDQNVRRHMRYLPGDDSVNPREVKRLINTYILQLKMLSPRLADRLDPSIVLALQCMSFRPDWRELYDHLAADPQLFQTTLRAAVGETEPPDTVWLSGARVALPTQFVQYLRTLAAPLLDVPDLHSYVSAAESTHSTDPSLLETQVMVNRLRQAAEDLASGSASVADTGKILTTEVLRLQEVRRRRTLGGPQLERPVAQLEEITRELTSVDPAGDASVNERNRWTSKIVQLLDSLDNVLRDLRRQTNVGAYS